MNSMSSAAKTVIAGNKAKRKLAPGPKRKALGDQLVPMSRDPIEFLLKIAREHPDIATFKLGPQRTFLLSKPEYIEDVLVANDWNFVKGRGLQRAKRVLGKGLLTSEGNLSVAGDRWPVAGGEGKRWLLRVIAIWRR